MRIQKVILAAVLSQVLAACAQKVGMESAASEMSGLTSHSRDKSSNARCVDGGGDYHVRLRNVEMQFDSSSRTLSAQIYIFNNEPTATSATALSECDIEVENLATGEVQILNSAAGRPAGYPWEAHPVEHQSPLFNTELSFGIGESRIVNLSVAVPEGFRPTMFVCALGMANLALNTGDLSKCYDGQVVQ